MMSLHTRGLTCLLMIEHACSRAQIFRELFIASEALQLRSEKSLLLWMAGWAEDASVKQGGRLWAECWMDSRVCEEGNDQFIRAFLLCWKWGWFSKRDFLGTVLQSSLQRWPGSSWMLLPHCAAPSCYILCIPDSCCCCCKTETSTGISGHRICWLNCSFSQA